MMMGGGTQLIIDNVDKPYIEIIDNKIISNDGTEEWDISNNIPNTDPEIVGEVYTWGHNSLDDLGFNSNGKTVQYPVKLGNTKWKNVLAGNRYTLAQTEDSMWFGWGNNNWGKLGQNSTLPARCTPIVFKHQTKWKYVTGNYNNVYALTPQNELYGWGLTDDVQLGVNHSLVFNCTPVKLSDTKWKLVKTRFNSVYAINENNEMYVWGSNTYGELGLGYTSTREYMLKLNGFWKDIYVGAQFALFISEDGYLYSSGYNECGQLGLGINDLYISAPFKLNELKWKFITCGYRTNYALAEDGDWYGWGHNSHGQLGLGHSYSIYRNPIKLNHWTKWIYLSSHGSSAVAQTGNGYWYGWGNNNSCDLGIGGSSNNPIFTPTKLNDTKWKRILMGNTHGIGLI